MKKWLLAIWFLVVIMLAGYGLDGLGKDIGAPDWLTGMVAVQLGYWAAHCFAPWRRA